jgi:hypothetical protein
VGTTSPAARRCGFLSLGERIKVRANLLRAVPPRFLRIDSVCDRVYYTIEVFKDFMIPEAQKANAAFMKFQFSVQIIAFPELAIMSPAV